MTVQRQIVPGSRLRCKTSAPGTGLARIFSGEFVLQLDFDFFFSLFLSEIEIVSHTLFVNKNSLYTAAVSVCCLSERSSNEPVLSRHRGSPTGVLPDAADRSALRTNKLLSRHQPRSTVCRSSLSPAHSSFCFFGPFSAASIDYC